MKDALKEIILDFQTTPIPKGVERELEYEFIENKAFICIGVRRCGKSTFLFQIIKNLLKDGIKRENILYLNFFDDRLSSLKHGNLDQITEAYYSIYPEKKNGEKIYCFFDELQELDNWESFVERLLRVDKFDVFISGSSAKMLSTEIATQMRGRSLTWELFPFSFCEFLKYKEINYSKLTSKNRLLVAKASEEYFIKGGFPEVRNLSKKLRILVHQEYYKTILHRDIIERHNISHPKALIDAGNLLINSAGSLYSINRIFAQIKSIGHKLGKSEITDYLNWFEDSFFLFSLKLYTPSINKQNINPKKIYCVDHALATSVSSTITLDSGHLLENLIFMHLRRISKNIFYYKTKNGKEVDFIWIDEDRKKHLVQVSFSLSNVETKKREVLALKTAMVELKESSGKIVTFSEEETIQENGLEIEVVPFWKYLLEIGG